MIHRAATADDIVRVATTLCADDAVAVFARRFDDDRAAFADELAAAQRFAVFTFAFARSQDAPAEALLGAQLVSPGTASMYWLASMTWPQVGYSAALHWLAFWRALVLPSLAASVRRAQCSIMAAHRAQARRLERVGFVCEGLERAAGRNGEDFLRYAWLNPVKQFVWRAGHLTVDEDLGALGSAHSTPRPVATEQPV